MVLPRDIYNPFFLSYSNISDFSVQWTVQSESLEMEWTFSKIEL